MGAPLSERDQFYEDKYFSVVDADERFLFNFKGDEPAERSMHKSTLIELLGKKGEGSEIELLEIELSRIGFLGELNRRNISVESFRESLEEISLRYQELSANDSSGFYCGNPSYGFLTS